LLVSLPSRRLVGDYLAIITLFFGQFFVTVVQNGNRISFLGLTRSFDITGGPNGIPDVDGWNLGGLKIGSLNGYYYAALVVFLLVLGAVYLVDTSRTGRAWKSLREDPLAAELMGMPVNRLKLIAFAFGAAIAGLAGALFAGLNTAVFAADFDVPTLIIIYAMLILGGAGSLGGVILGALVVNVSLELLRTPDHATLVFYALLIVALALKPTAVGLARRGARRHPRARLRRARDLRIGVAARRARGRDRRWQPRACPRPLDASPIEPAADREPRVHCARLRRARSHAHARLAAEASPSSRRSTSLPSSGTTGWSSSRSVTRLILIGVILIVLMNARPQGLLGSARVEII